MISARQSVFARLDSGLGLSLGKQAQACPTTPKGVAIREVKGGPASKVAVDWCSRHRQLHSTHMSLRLLEDPDLYQATETESPGETMETLRESRQRGLCSCAVP